LVSRRRTEGAVTLHDYKKGKSAAAGVGDIQARLMLVLMCLVWGITWPLMKIALEAIPPFSMRTLSCGFGAVTLFAICLVKRRSLRIPTIKTAGHLIAISFLNIVGFSLLTAFAQMAEPTSRVAILAYTMPIWTVILAWMILGERPNRMQGIAFGLCAFGLAILVYPLAVKGVLLGVVLAVASGLTWGAGTVYIKWARMDADPIGVAAWQLIIAFFTIGACLLGFEGRLNLDHADTGALLATAFTGVAGAGVAYAMWFEVVRRVSAATAALGVLGSPVVGVLASVAILGERLSATDIIGFALIFAASSCVLLTPSRPAKDVKIVMP
jgi:drug/metabolite transporter (DMT)-like permease